MNLLHCFWNLEIESSTAARLRIAFASVALVHLIFSFPHPMSFYFGQTGLISGGVGRVSWKWSLLPWLGPTALSWFYGLALTSLVLVVCGSQKTAFLLISWLWHITALRLNAAVGWHIDQLLCLTNLYLFFIPCSGRGARRNNRVCAPGLRLMQIQLSVIYLESAFSKLLSVDWYSGRAVGYFLESWLAVHPLAVPFGASVILTYAVIGMELGIGLFCWNRRLLWIAFTFAVILHGGIFLTTKIKLFSVAMLVFQIVYVYPWIESWVSRYSKPEFRIRFVARVSEEPGGKDAQA